MDFVVRKMREEDITQVAKIEAMTFTEPWSEQSFLSELKNPQATILVAEANGEIAGFADMREICRECYINNIAILPQYRKMGMGTALMVGLQNACTENAEFITLEVRESNNVAISLYKKLGYVQVGVRRDFYREPTENASLMTKLLKQRSKDMIL